MYDRAVCLTVLQTLHQLEQELDVQIVPGTEVMVDVGSHHFVKSFTKSHRVLVPQPSDDPHDPLVRSTSYVRPQASFISNDDGGRILPCLNGSLLCQLIELEHLLEILYNGMCNSRNVHTGHGTFVVSSHVSRADRSFSLEFDGCNTIHWSCYTRPRIQQLYLVSTVRDLPMYATNKSTGSH